MQNYRVVPLKNVRISDPFWSYYKELVRNTVLPYQWEALNDRIPDAEPSHAIRNFRIAAGLEEGEFVGERFQDTDVAKWLEAVAYSLETHPDPHLEDLADGVIDLIELAQQPDGYLNTFFIIKEPEKRWTDLHECHELYIAGHMIEAAVAYYKATGKRKLLDVVCRFADHIDTVFGPEPGKIHGYDGHQEIELALVKLYEVTGNEKYLKLGKYFIDERGKEPNFLVQEWEARKGQSSWFEGKAPPPDLAYNQAHKPVKEQEAAVGHAVRAVYMYTAMADLARETKDQQFLDACKRLWNNIVHKQLYITGGIGSTRQGEAFTFDYDLPNDTVYAESCASIGLIFFAFRMLQLEVNRSYADVMEKALYNNVLAAMSRDGKSFFYVNPLEVWPEACRKNPDKKHVKPTRQKWFGCACCPPNIARLLASLNQYIYTSRENTVYTHLYIGGEAEIETSAGVIQLNQESRYPWDGKITIAIGSSPEEEISLAFRIPAWCPNWSVSINGRKEAEVVSENGYVLFTRCWRTGDRIQLNLDMPIQIIQAHPQVRSTAGKIAIQRGPLVYCLEEVDNGDNLPAFSVDPSGAFGTETDDHSLDGAVVIRGKAARTREDDWHDCLYQPIQADDEEEVPIKAIPYFMWGNREQGEMLVWMRRK